MAGGSQIIISADGITIKTAKHFKVFAGQHTFEHGAKVISTLPNLPISSFDGFNQGFHLISDEQIQNLPFKLFNSKHSYQFNAHLNEKQQTQWVQTATESEKLELKYSGDDDINHQWNDE